MKDEPKVLQVTPLLQVGGAEHVAAFLATAFVAAEGISLVSILGGPFEDYLRARQVLYKIVCPSAVIRRGEGVLARLAGLLPAFSTRCRVSRTKAVTTLLPPQEKFLASVCPDFCERFETLLRSLPCNIVHIHSLTCCDLLKIAKRCGRSVIYSQHNMVSQRHGGTDLSFLQEGLRWVDQVVCVSQACRDDFVATTRFDAAKVVVIPNPSFLATGVKQPAQPVLRVGTASNLHAAKGIDVLLSAWAMLKERGVTLELQIAGGEADVVRRWQLVAHRLGIGESVHFLGVLDSAERMDAFYREIGLMVVPSRSESFSLQVLEACSRGIPVVVSDIPALREVLDDAGVFFSVGNARELADCVEMFARSHDVLARYSNKVFARWERCFSTEKVIDSYQRLYFELGTKSLQLLTTIQCVRGSRWQCSNFQQ